jgi:hypothetical protein
VPSFEKMQDAKICGNPKIHKTTQNKKVFSSKIASKLNSSKKVIS